MKASLTRRKFLQGAGIAAAGAAVAGTLASCAPKGEGEMQNLETNQDAALAEGTSGDKFFCTCS